MQKRTICFENNIFDVIRLWAILQVTIGHCKQHLEIAPWCLDMLFQFPGIVVLFALSGFLIAASYDRLPDTPKGKKSYLRRRFIRIFPGLWFSVLVSTICIFVFYTVKPSIMEGVIYLFTQLTGLNFYTGDWLRGYGVGAPNGSLWTIMLELQFYVILMICWKWLKQQKARVHVALYCLCVMFNVLDGKLAIYSENIFYKLYSCSVLPYLYMFMTGVFLYKYRDRMFRFLSIRKWTGWGSMALLIIGMIVFPKIVPNIGGYTNIFIGALLSVFTILFAFVPGRKIRFKHDFSYGIYLYHMIIVNVFVEIGWINEFMFFYLAIAGSILCSFFFEVCMERRIFGNIE